MDESSEITGSFHFANKASLQAHFILVETCSVFIKTHLLNYRTALSRTLQILQFPDLPELYEYIEVNTPRPGSITEVMGRLVFLETDDARVKMEGADRNDIPMLKETVDKTVFLPILKPNRVEVGKHGYQTT